MAEENEDVDLEGEIETLKSIYIKELDVKQDESGCQSITLHLFPATADVESQKYVRLSLTFNLPEKYPKVIPEIVINNTRGLSDDDIKRIYDDACAKANEKRGTAMLFEIIEVVQEYLTKSNLPSCDCAVCLCSFSKDDIFIKTECYHYFHSHCLATYVQHCRKMEKNNILHAAEEDNDDILCPICRLTISFDIYTPELFPLPEESLKAEDFVLTDEIKKGQLHREKILMKQQSQGGIINVDAEKNKFLLEISMAPTVEVSLSVLGVEVSENVKHIPKSQQREHATGLVNFEQHGTGTKSSRKKQGEPSSVDGATADGVNEFVNDSPLTRKKYDQASVRGVRRNHYHKHFNERRCWSHKNWLDGVQKPSRSFLQSASWVAGKNVQKTNEDNAEVETKKETDCAKNSNQEVTMQMFLKHEQDGSVSEAVERKLEKNSVSANRSWRTDRFNRTSTAYDANDKETYRTKPFRQRRYDPKHFGGRNNWRQNQNVSLSRADNAEIARLDTNYKEDSETQNEISKSCETLQCSIGTKQKDFKEQKSWSNENDKESAYESVKIESNLKCVQGRYRNQKYWKSREEQSAKVNDSTCTNIQLNTVNDKRTNYDENTIKHEGESFQEEEKVKKYRGSKNKPRQFQKRWKTENEQTISSSKKLTAQFEPIADNTDHDKHLREKIASQDMIEKDSTQTDVHIPPQNDTQAQRKQQDTLLCDHTKENQKITDVRKPRRKNSQISHLKITDGLVDESERTLQNNNANEENQSTRGGKATFPKTQYDKKQVDETDKSNSTAQKDHRRKKRNIPKVQDSKDSRSTNIEVPSMNSTNGNKNEAEAKGTKTEQDNANYSVNHMGMKNSSRQKKKYYKKKMECQEQDNEHKEGKSTHSVKNEVWDIGGNKIPVVVEICEKQAEPRDISGEVKVTSNICVDLNSAKKLRRPDKRLWRSQRASSRQVNATLVATEDQSPEKLNNVREMANDTLPNNYRGRRNNVGSTKDIPGVKKVDSTTQKNDCHVGTDGNKNSDAKDECDKQEKSSQSAAEKHNSHRSEGNRPYSRGTRDRYYWGRRKNHMYNYEENLVETPASSSFQSMQRDKNESAISGQNFDQILSEPKHTQNVTSRSEKRLSGKTSENLTEADTPASKGINVNLNMVAQDERGASTKSYTREMNKNPKPKSLEADTERTCNNRDDQHLIQEPKTLHHQHSQIFPETDTTLESKQLLSTDSVQHEVSIVNGSQSLCSVDNDEVRLHSFHPPGFPVQPMYVRPPPGFISIHQ